MSQIPYIVANPPKCEPVSDKCTYNVSLETKITGIGKPVNTTITYTLEIAYSNNDFTFKKSNIQVDGNGIPKKINELYLKTGAPLNEIEFGCTEQGNIKELYKYEQLLQHWEQSKKQVSQGFTGEAVSRLVQQLDKTYNNKQILIERVNNNIVLQAFYRSFISDYLIYYGQSNTAFTNTGFLSNVSLAFRGIKTLGLKNDQLHLQTDAKLNKAKINRELLDIYFKNKVEDFNLDDLEISMEDRTYLDYKSVWIQQSTVSQIIQAKNYKKELVLTLQQI